MKLLRTVINVLLATLLCSCAKLQTGDLIFVEEASSDGMDGAIASATADGGKTSFVHVAIVDVAEDGAVWIIEATPKRGVDRHSLDVFMQDNSDSSGNTVPMTVMRLKKTPDLDACVQRARSLCGSRYDFSFLPDNDAWYCSELVYDTFIDNGGNRIFTAAPMNFLNDDGTCPEYWTNLFDSLGMDVPQGVPGTNPQDMSSSPLLVRVRGISLNRSTVK